jgi:hypothetical protein
MDAAILSRDNTHDSRIAYPVRKPPDSRIHSKPSAPLVVALVHTYVCLFDVAREVPESPEARQAVIAMRRHFECRRTLSAMSVGSGGGISGGGPGSGSGGGISGGMPGFGRSREYPLWLSPLCIPVMTGLPIIQLANSQITHLKNVNILKLGFRPEFRPEIYIEYETAVTNN